MWLSDFTLVLPDAVRRGSLRIENGQIAEITDGPVPCGIDGRGHTIFAGFIDMHGDMIEQELEPRARVDFPMPVALNALDARLAASGVTTAYAAVSFSRAAAQGARRSYDHTSQVIRALHAARPDAGWITASTRASTSPLTMRSACWRTCWRTGWSTWCR